MDHTQCVRVGQYIRTDVHHTHEDAFGWWLFPSEVPALTSDELGLLRTYERGPTIWDAASLMEGVLRLDELGLIEPVPDSAARQLTSAGRRVLEERS